MVKVVQNIPTMLVYLPSQINVRTQVSFSVPGAPFTFNWSSNRHTLCKTQSVHHCPNPLSNYKCTAFVWLSFNAAPSSLFPPPVEPLSVHWGGFGGGDVRQEEAVGCWRAGSDRERIQATSRGQKLVPAGISELKCLFSRNTVCAQVYLRVLSSQVTDTFHWQ